MWKHRLMVRENKYSILISYFNTYQKLGRRIEMDFIKRLSVWGLFSNASASGTGLEIFFEQSGTSGHYGYAAQRYSNGRVAAPSGSDVRVGLKGGQYTK